MNNKNKKEKNGATESDQEEASSVEEDDGCTKTNKHETYTYCRTEED